MLARGDIDYIFIVHHCDQQLFVCVLLRIVCIVVVVCQRQRKEVQAAAVFCDIGIAISQESSSSHHHHRRSCFHSFRIIWCGDHLFYLPPKGEGWESILSVYYKCRLYFCFSCLFVIHFYCFIYS